VLDFLYTAVSWVLLRWHQLFTAVGLKETGGLNWALSIVFLVITARLLMFRFFVKQVHYQRKMQQMQPRIQKLREQHKNDRAAMQREMMKLQQEEGFNPIAGCLPMLLQIPIFISLFHVLRHLANSVHLVAPNPKLTLYSFTSDETLHGAQAKLFGAPLAASLRDNAHKVHDLLGGDVSSTRAVTIVLVLVSSAATYFTQVLVRRGQTTVPEGTAATIQKVMLYFIPLSVLFSGLIFPLGVLLYWFTSNMWTLGQQAYINSSTRTPRPKPVRSASSGRSSPRSRARSRCGRRSRCGPTAPSTSRRPRSSTMRSPTTATRLPTPRSSTPKPGARPNRGSSTSRSGGKRPSQAKKRR